MAEYVKLDALMEYCQNQKDKTISCNDLARFNTSDVIERSKIDKAIEELQNMKVYGHTKTARLVSLPEVLSIIKKNIGE